MDKWTFFELLCHTILVDSVSIIREYLKVQQPFYLVMLVAYITEPNRIVLTKLVSPIIQSIERKNSDPGFNSKNNLDDSRESVNSSDM